ncbi:hypothetical protein FRC01_012806, partial [Tulasnella sp. 417]
MKPGSTKYLTQWMYDLWDNRFLFWSVMAGFVTIFPILYVPTLSDTVFDHTGITWEWGIVFVEALLFFLGVELWKWGKRVYIRHHFKDDYARNPEADLEAGAFSSTNGRRSRENPITLPRNDDPPRTDHDQPQQSLPALLSRPAHVLTLHQLAKELRTNPEGLSDSEAADRVKQHGRNELEGGGGTGALRILIKQIVNAMMLVLILAMAVSFAIKSWISSAVIAAVVVINIFVGFLQEYAAEKTMDSLRTLSSPTATVVRASQTKVIPTAEIAPGDVVELRVGDTIPADMRLIDCMNFETDEALLT